MEYIISFMETYGYAAMFIAMVLENANIPIPSEIVLGFAGYLISQGIFDLHTTMVVGTLAGIVGSILKYGKYVFFNEHKFELAEKMFNKYGGVAIFFGRLLPGVRTFISFPAGMARYPLWHFIVWTVLGTIPWTILLVYLGKVLGENWKDLIQYNHEFLLVVIVIFAIVAAVLGFKYYKNRRKS